MAFDASNLVIKEWLINHDGEMHRVWVYTTPDTIADVEVMTFDGFENVPTYFATVEASRIFRRGDFIAVDASDGKVLYVALDQFSLGAGFIQRLITASVFDFA